MGFVYCMEGANGCVAAMKLPPGRIDFFLSTSLFPHLTRRDLQLWEGATLLFLVLFRTAATSHEYTYIYIYMYICIAYKYLTCNVSYLYSPFCCLLNAVLKVIVDDSYV